LLRDDEKIKMKPVVQVLEPRAPIVQNVDRVPKIQINTTSARRESSDESAEISDSLIQSFSNVMSPEWTPNRVCQNFIPIKPKKLNFKE
jgi:hypothetical protein